MQAVRHTVFGEIFALKYLQIKLFQTNKRLQHIFCLPNWFNDTRCLSLILSECDVLPKIKLIQNFLQIQLGQNKKINCFTGNRACKLTSACKLFNIFCLISLISVCANRSSNCQLMLHVTVCFGNCLRWEISRCQFLHVLLSLLAKWQKFLQCAV